MTGRKFAWPILKKIDEKERERAWRMAKVKRRTFGWKLAKTMETSSEKIATAKEKRKMTEGKGEE